MNVDLMIINESSIATFWIFASSMKEEPRNDSFPDKRIVFRTRFDSKSVSLQ